MTVHPIVLGTAGHIDHGKTALVKALTGIDTDRLKVEKERGITTELGFAHLDLGGRRVAVVDVPGHERFIRSMVAGATGLDLVCLVVAADEGVMPQTREHLDVCDLVGVRRGVIVLTKRDLVDDEWLALVTEEVRVATVGTFLADAPVVAVSARTGAGLDELRATLTAAIAALPPRPAGGVLRLPIDRVFTIRGFGTVVTGTIAGGVIRPGDEVVVLPRGVTTRVRGLEVHGAAASEAHAGMRCAVNLAGIATDELVRGDVLAHPGAVAPSHILDVRLRLLAAAPAPLAGRAKALLHHATTQVPVTVVVLEASEVAPGGTALAQLRLDAETPIAALPGDHFLLRGFVPQANHGTTIGGGEVVRVHAPKARRGAGDHAALLRRFDAARAADRVALEVRAAAHAGLTVAELARRLGAPPAELTTTLAELVASRDLIVAGAGDAAVYLHAEPVAALEQRALGLVDELATAGDGVSKEELRARLPHALATRAYEQVLDGLVRRGGLEVAGDRVRRTRVAPAPALSPVESALADRFRAWGIEPPRPKEVAAAAGLTEPVARAALDRLLATRLVTKIKPDLYVDAQTVAALRARLEAHLDAHGQVTPQEWKDLTGTTRKYSIPLAEYFDAEKLTLRVGDLRRRRK